MLKTLLGAMLLFTGSGTIDSLDSETTIQVETASQNKIEVKLNEGLLYDPSIFNLYLEEATMEKDKVEVWVDSSEEMIRFVEELYNKLPHEVILKSKHFNTKDLKKMFEQTLGYKIEDLTPQIHGLASYKVTAGNKFIRLTDDSNPQYSAATIQVAFDAYTDDLAELLKNENEIEALLNVYNFIFDNFKYTGNGSHFMTVGNIGNGKLACNGISYLADTLLEKVGLQSFIRSGYSHYWNVVTLSNGKEITFDVTSDIVLKEYKATLGLNTKDHINKTGNIGFFSAGFVTGKYKDVDMFDFNQK